MKVLLIEDDAAIAGAIVDSLEAVSWDFVKKQARPGSLVSAQATGMSFCLT
jgi:DNA-binding response OmpR family regulator